MSRKVGSTANELLGGAHTYAKAVEERLGCRIQFQLTINRRVGVFTIVTRALHWVDGRAAGIWVQCKSEWPNAQAVDLGGHLLQEVMKVDNLLAQEELAQYVPNVLGG